MRKLKKIIVIIVKSKQKRLNENNNNYVEKNEFQCELYRFIANSILFY